MPAFSLKNTYSLLYWFALFFIGLSFCLRLTLLFLSLDKADLTLLEFLRIFSEGLLFDIGVACFIVAPYALYLLFLPTKRNSSRANKIITYAAFLLAILLIMFSFFAEYTFWREFESRFNFIAVDYLVYTYEVINNINESYPLPFLIPAILAISLSVLWIFQKRGFFIATFQGTVLFTQRLLIAVIIFLISLLYAFKINNSLAEATGNRYRNELAKAGIYSFFAAFKNNEINYDQFYSLLDNDRAFAIVKDQLRDSLSTFSSVTCSVKRNISGTGSMLKPNVIMITIESLSADFMAHFGNRAGLTPVLDSLSDKGIMFTNMYATGTRTVRGMEALSLAIPPTPGSSIVRRPDNDSLATVGHIFQEHGYQTGFFYGGDGYFDNMNQYFGSNGYAVTDRGRNLLIKDAFKSHRATIPDSAVHFENAWGISDEDLYDAVIKDADNKYKDRNLFYDFVMTTSNHRPYTYPAGKIDIPPGTGRDGAVKYTDYAIGQFIQKACTRPWFKNTVLIFVADHCANSAGKDDIDVSKYHIPAIIYNCDQPAFKIDRMCSQIDLYPTLFQLLNWNYTSNLYGQNVLAPSYQPRIFLGTYQKLAYMKNDSLVILSVQQKTATFKYLKESDKQVPISADTMLVNEAIANYQTAYYLFKNGGLKQ